MAGGKKALRLHESESDAEAVKKEESKETMRAEPYIGPPSTATTLAVEDVIEKVKVELKNQNS